MDTPLILVLHPDDTGCDLMVDALRKSGFRVRCAPDAAAALESLAQQPRIALLVADFPGHQLAMTRLRREPALERVPLLAICQSPQDAPEDAVAFLRTPADVSELLQWAFLLTGADPEALARLPQLLPSKRAVC